MTEPVYSSRTSHSSMPSGPGEMTIDIRPMIEDVSQVMTKHITNILSGVIGEYTVYKETHDVVMNLPCVRKLQERIHSLERRIDPTNPSFAACASGGTTFTDISTTRQDEIAQLQTAIAELNRYIGSLEAKVGLKSVQSEQNEQCRRHVADDDDDDVVAASTQAAVHHQDEESVRLEVHEEECEQSHATLADDNTFMQTTNVKNVIISSNVIDNAAVVSDNEYCEEDDTPDNETEELAQEEGVEETDEEDNTNDETADEEVEDEDEENAGEEEEEEEAEEEAEEEPEEEAEEEPEEEPEEAEEEAEEEEDEAVEDVEEEEEAEEDAGEEAEIEVSEITIKGKKYFTTDPQNGTIYACVDEDVGDEVGVFKGGVAVFNKGKK
jgi:hypothetical protein